MINEALLSYIRSAQAQGLSLEAIKTNLKTGGWNDADIAEALRAITPAVHAVPPPPPPPTPAPFTPMNTNIRPVPATSSPLSSFGTITPISLNTQQNMGIQNQPQKHKSFLPIIIVVLILILLGGGAFYMYYAGLGPFARPPYSEGNLISGILDKSSLINSSKYSMSASLSMGPRDADAKPFEVELIDQETINKKYENDYKRAGNVNHILNSISRRESFPKKLTDIDLSEWNNYYPGASITDPKTGREYDYTLTEDGRNFALKVTFETSNAISKLKQGYEFKPENTLVEGQTVTFTRDSRSQYFYLSSTPPKPLILELQDQARYLPDELSFDAKFTATADWSAESAGEWVANFDTNGSFGDLSFKVNLDGMKKGQNFYFKINNIPSFFFSSFSKYKNKWLKVDTAVAPNTDDDSYTDYTDLQEIASALVEKEKEYKKDRAEFVNLLKKSAKYADEEKLFSFKNEPYEEKLGNRALYRYDLKINKNAILPFYKKVIEEAKKAESKDYVFEDTGLLDYLESEDFDKFFTYFDANTELALWTDKKGFPASLQYKIRLIPPDTAEQLAGRQANLVFNFTLDEINQPVVITPPEDAEDLFKALETIAGSAEKKSTNARIKASLANMRAQAEIFYDSKNSYGGVTNGNCYTSGTLFASPAIISTIESVKKMGNEKYSIEITCYGSPTAYAVSASLLDTETDKGYWCVDSTGASKKVSSRLTSNVCPNN